MTSKSKGHFGAGGFISILLALNTLNFYQQKLEKICKIIKNRGTKFAEIIFYFLHLSTEFYFSPRHRKTFAHTHTHRPSFSGICLSKARSE